MEKILTSLEKYLLYATVLLFPISIFPISPNLFVVPKLTVLLSGIALIILARTLRIIYSGKLTLRSGRYDFPVTLIMAAYLISAFIRTPNKMEAFLLPGSASIVIVGGLLYFLINQYKKKDKAIITKLLVASGAIFSVITLLAFTGVLAKVPQLPTIMKVRFFTPEGGFLPSAIFLVTLLPVGVGAFISEKAAQKKVLWGAKLAVILIALALSLYNLIPGTQYSPKFPSHSTDWNIAVDALKESPVWGIGPGNYLTAFNRFRPVSYNQTDLWALKFSTARSFYLTVLTETGMFGAAGIILLLVALYRSIREQFDKKGLGFKKDGKKLKVTGNPSFLSLVILLIVLAIYPATLISTCAIFIFLSLVTTGKEVGLNLKMQGTDDSTSQFMTRLPAIIVSAPVIVGLVYFGYRGSRIALAEYTFNKAVNSLTQNKAQETYSLINQAVNLNPRVDRYRATNARINLALANSLSTNKNITESDRANIGQLVQQAISESKAAVALNPPRAGNWESLGALYRSIIPLTQGADVFALQTLRQAIALDPINPNLRIALGGIYYAQGDYDNAVRVFELAVAAKPDHANARYNLAFALRESGKLDRAITEMTRVLSLTDNTTEDYKIAKQALESMQQKRIDEQAAKQGESLTPPQEAQEPVLEPPLDLPEESEPPEPPLTPTPTPSPTPTEVPEEEVTPTPTAQPTPTPAE